MLNVDYVTLGSVRADVLTQTVITAKPDFGFEHMAYVLILIMSTLLLW